MKFRGREGVPTFRISGVYPRTAFFDFSAYSRGYIKAISAIADYQIKPHWVGGWVNGWCFSVVCVADCLNRLVCTPSVCTQGKNPFAEPCTPEEVGGYEVYVTLHGDQV